MAAADRRDEDRREADRLRRVAAGNWLRSQRERLGLSVRAMGAAVGLEGSQFSNYENGRSSPDDRRAELIAKVVGLPILTVRRHLGMWLPEETDKLDVLAAIDADEKLTPEKKAHLSHQYPLLVEASEAERLAAELDPDGLAIRFMDAHEANPAARAEIVDVLRRHGILPPTES